MYKICIIVNGFLKRVYNEKTFNDCINVGCICPDNCDV